MGRRSHTNTMGALLALFSSLLLPIHLAHFAGRAAASSSTTSAQLVFNILKSTKAGVDTWDAATLVQSLGTNWKPDTTGTKEADAIPALPGQPHGAAQVRQYGGYVDVGDGGKLYYYFAEPTVANASDMPLLLWITGGPGCSSIGAGAFLQHGPFLVNDDGKSLRENPYAWINASPVIYLDSPVNVGFSYSDNENGTAQYDESKTAVGNLRFLLGWLERFPEYKSRKVVLAGDGYAGIFVNQLAELIVEHNKLAEGGDTVINHSRILLVNPTLDVESEAFGIVDIQYTQGMVSTRRWRRTRAICRRTSIRSEACLAQIRKLPVNDLGSGPVYAYDYTATVCNSDLKPGHRVEEYYECSEKAVDAYLSQKEVQQALHGNFPRVSNSWVQCNPDVASKYQFTTSSSMPIVNRLVAAGVNVTIISGDVGMVVPMSGTRYAIKQLQLPLRNDWQTWLSNATTPAGYTETYGSSVIVATVREAGHVVTKNNPERALKLLQLVYAGNVTLGT